MKPQLLGIGGYAFAGKDAVADILVKELGWHKTYMSKPLEKALLTLNPWVTMGNEDFEPVRYSVVHQSVGYNESKKIPEVRRLLQVLGTEIGRNMFGEDSWVDLMINEVDDAMSMGKNVVVTGIRFENELGAIEDSGGQGLWVTRPGITAVNNHASEKSVNESMFTKRCKNDGSLDDLRAWVVNQFG